MTSAELIADSFGRIREAVHSAVEDLTTDELVFRIDTRANSICWLVWHLTRIQDDHVAHVAGTEQVWTTSGWATRFDLPFDNADTGYGHDAGQVGAVRTDSETLLAYHDEVLRGDLPIRPACDRRRSRSGGGRALRPACDPGGETRERHRRRPAARGAGCLHPGNPRAQVIGVQWRRDDGYFVSDDRDLVDVDRVHGWLANESYWASGRPLEVVRRSIEGSITLGCYAPDGNQAGICRWVTDCATFGWLCDVFVDVGQRGQGLGVFLVESAVQHPAVQGLRLLLLGTRDAQGLYSRFGFVTATGNWMEKRSRDGLRN